MKGSCVMKKKISQLALLFLCSFLLLGCGSSDGKSKWFKMVEPDQQDARKKGDLEPDKLFVKQGTSFYQVYQPAKNASLTEAGDPVPSRVIPFVNDEHMIPIAYKGELIAYSFYEKPLDFLQLERFVDAGYSFGIVGAHIDDRGYFCINHESEVTEGSEFAKLYKDTESKEIRIVSIDGKKIDESNVDMDGGFIKGLERGKEYTVDMYIGSDHVIKTLIADTHITQSAAIYRYGVEDIDFTDNNYMALYLPKDLPSGYYLANTYGVFYYTGRAKGEKKDETTESSREYKESTTPVKRYKVNIPYKTQNIRVSVTFENGFEGSTGSIISPTGEIYALTEAEDGLEVMLLEAIPGDWEVEVASLDKVKDVTVSTSRAEEGTTKRSYEVIFADNDTNIEFVINTSSTDKESLVYGYVTAPDGKVYDLIYEVNDKGEGKLSKELAFLLKGTYTIDVYYYAEQTTLGDITKIKTSETETDVIHVG